jgi:hypothetical protein
MKERKWYQDLKRKLELAMMSNDYANLREKYVVGKWRLLDGCKSAEQFDQIIAKWWKEYDRTALGLLTREVLFEGEDWRFEQGAHAQEEGEPTFADDETTIVRCLEECDRIARRFGLTKKIVLRSLFLPQETIRSMDKLDPRDFIHYQIVSCVPIYQDSPLGTRLIRAAKESNEVREALIHFMFTPRLRQWVKEVREPFDSSTQVEPRARMRVKNNKSEILSPYELFTVTLHLSPPDLPRPVVGAAIRKALSQIRALCRALGFNMRQKRGRKSNFLLALECARLKDDEGRSYADIGKRFGWKLQYDSYGERLNQCSTARYYVREGRKLRQQLGISAKK